MVAVLSRLLWNEIAPSERRILDAKGVFLAQKKALDCEYLAHWAAGLDVKETLDQLLEQVSRLDA